MHHRLCKHIHPRYSCLGLRCLISCSLTSKNYIKFLMGRNTSPHFFVLFYSLQRCAKQIAAILCDKVALPLLPKQNGRQVLHNSSSINFSYITQQISVWVWVFYPYLYAHACARKIAVQHHLGTLLGMQLAAAVCPFFYVNKLHEQWQINGEFWRQFYWEICRFLQNRKKSKKCKMCSFCYKNGLKMAHFEQKS